MAAEPCTVIAQFEGWTRVGEMRVLSFAIHVDLFTPELQAVLATCMASDIKSSGALQLTVGPAPRPPPPEPRTKGEG
jgi:hypothetical protein